MSHPGGRKKDWIVRSKNLYLRNLHLVGFHAIRGRNDRRDGAFTSDPALAKVYRTRREAECVASMVPNGVALERPRP